MLARIPIRYIRSDRGAPAASGPARVPASEAAAVHTGMVGRMRAEVNHVTPRFSRPACQVVIRGASYEPGVCERRRTPRKAGSGEHRVQCPSKELKLHESAVIQLLLSVSEPIEALQRDLGGLGERIGAEVRISTETEAHLSGTGFKVESITPERQAVSQIERTEWRW
jgi:hypothetical protein